MEVENAAINDLVSAVSRMNFDSNSFMYQLWSP
jgi:hypothetical protein